MISRRLFVLGLLATCVALCPGSPAEAGDAGTPGAPPGEEETQADCVSPPGFEREPPSWLTRRRSTVLVDSVLLGGVSALRRTMPRWHFTVIGWPAVMVGAMEQELRTARRRIAPLVVVGLGYNSLWERERRNYARWAQEFDRQAKKLLRTLKREGAEQVVWVTLRDARRSVIPSSALWQFDKYAWYFGYVNERLRRLDRERDDLVLADWAAVSDRRGITYDAIHLNPDGAALMSRTIRSAIETEGKLQTVEIPPPAGECPATDARPSGTSKAAAEEVPGLGPSLRGGGAPPSLATPQPARSGVNTYS
jgi:hypothetical protein